MILAHSGTRFRSAFYSRIEFNRENRRLYLRQNSRRSHRRGDSFSRGEAAATTRALPPTSFLAVETFDPEREAERRGTSRALGHEEAVNITTFQRRVKCPVRVVRVRARYQK